MYRMLSLCICLVYINSMLSCTVQLLKLSSIKVTCGSACAQFITLATRIKMALHGNIGPFIRSQEYWTTHAESIVQYWHQGS